MKLNEHKHYIYIVSGYPRSGTSLVMQMLEAGGMPVLFDDAKEPNIHNPRGYYELKASLRLGAKDQDKSWVESARGLTVKVMAYHLRHLPADYAYKVIFMKRKIAEVLASWDKMNLTRKNIKLSAEEQVMAFKTEYAVYEARLEQNRQMEPLFVLYNELLGNPTGEIAKIAGFLHYPLDEKAMLGAIDPELYRNRC